MERPVCLYHSDYARRGRDFDLAKVSLDALVEQGWVDHPGKIGENVWGPAAQDDVNRIEAAFKNGDLGPLGRLDGHANQSQPEMEVAEAERRNLYERLRTQEDEIEHLKRQLREGREKEADIGSDARKLEGMREVRPVDHAVQGADVEGAKDEEDDNAEAMDL